MRQSLDMVKKAGAKDGDHAGFVNIPLSAKEVEAVVYMRETQPQTYRVSFRSKGDLDISKVAEKFGGGGHKNAAGIVLSEDIGKSVNLIISSLKEYIR